MNRTPQATKNLYESLGVPKTANKQTIKKAYRSRVKKHHTDKGGNIEDFLRVQLAYDVLSDDEKRKRYDETGLSEGVPESKAEQIFMQLVLKAIDAAEDNPLASAIDTLKHQIMEAKSNITIIMRKRDHFKKWSSLIKRKDDAQNLIAIAVTEQVTRADQALASTKEQIEVLNKALAVGNEYSCEAPARFEFSVQTNAYYETW